MVLESNGKSTLVNIPDDPLKTLTVDDMYDKDKYDFATMEEEDVFKMLEYVDQFLFILK
jgi:hypothetical protein